MDLDRSTRSLLGFRSQRLDVAPTVARPSKPEAMTDRQVVEWLLRLEALGQITIDKEGVIRYGRGV